MEDAIKLLVFDFINFISFLKKQPNVPKSWVSRIKRLESKCDNLGLTSKSTSVEPPSPLIYNVSNLPPLSSPHSSPPETPNRLSVKSSPAVDEAYVADWDREDNGFAGGVKDPSHVALDRVAPRNPWSLKPEECDRDLLMETAIKIGKIYVKNFKNLISSTLGKKAEKTALLTNDFRFLLYKANKPKIDTVLDIRGALIQSNKFKNRRFTITCSTDKVDTLEFEACDEEERDSWVYALFKASKGVLSKDSFGGGGSSAGGFDENTYQKVQEEESYNLIMEDDDDLDDDDEFEDEVDCMDSYSIYKSPPNGQPVNQEDYPLMEDDDTDEDFEDDIHFDQEEIDLLPAPPSPLPAESLYEFEEDSSCSSISSDNSSLDLCEPVDTSEIIPPSPPPPSLPAKNQAPLKGPTDIPPKSKCIKKDHDKEIPPELPPKKGSLKKKKGNKSKRSSEPLPSPPPLSSKIPETPTKTTAPFPPPPRQQKQPTSPDVGADEENIKKEKKSKKKLSMPKKFLRNSSSSRVYDVNPASPPTSPTTVRPISMDMIKTELKEKVELRNKRMQLRSSGTLDDIKSNASSNSDSKEPEFLGKKPSEVKTSSQGVKPQVLKPKPVLRPNQFVGKLQGPNEESTPSTPCSTSTELKNNRKNTERSDVPQMEALQISEDSSTTDFSEDDFD